jgi:hypothetical protein
MNEWTDWHELRSNMIELVAGVDCWIWTAGTTATAQGASHGRVRYLGKSEYAHRAAFHSFNGYMPSSGRMVCHRCGVGLCVRPGHLYDGDAGSNGKDTSIMGTGTAILSFQDAYDIRVMYMNGSRLAEIAEKYNIAFGSVYPIVIGKSYRHAPMPKGLVTGRRARQPLSSAEVSDIREMLANGVPQSKISKKHNVAQSIISRINTGVRHKAK